ncbi:MAG: tyrosine-type recombinase/integrase [Clostridium sp.]|uniref:tyrosine-type recombinase/integrase n=1 Tax=Clostridium sp. TaxID=1506 RepID=UPI003F2C27E9
MAKIQRVKYFTQEKLALINQKNWKDYEKYRRSNIIKNREVESTTYNVYANYVKHFLVYLAENWDDLDWYDKEFMDNAVDIMEGYMMFCQDTLKNNKKVINTKVSAVSSFFHWSVKRKLIKYHPFDKRLDRMKGANEEEIINSYFLSDEEVEVIRKGLDEQKRYDIQDKILFNLAIDSANRIGAISKITLSSMDLDECLFSSIREKRGKRVDIVFEESTRDLIEEWLDYRKNNTDKLEVDSLFIVKHKGEYKPMSKNSLQVRIKKIGYIIGLEDFHAHCTRKTSLNSIFEKTGDIALTAELGNHKSVSTTQAHYLKKKTKAETRARIKEVMKEKEMLKKKAEQERKETE